MTDRHAGYLVVLKDSIREDDDQATLQAIQQIKGVISVQPIVSDPKMEIAQTQATYVVAEAVIKFIAKYGKGD